MIWRIIAILTGWCIRCRCSSVSAKLEEGVVTLECRKCMKATKL